MFNIDPNKVKPLNEGGRRLKVGAHPYRITAVGMVTVKNDPTGKEKQVVIDVRNGTDYNSKVYLSLMSRNEVIAEIAQRTLSSFWSAASLKGSITPDTLKRLVGKTVIIEAKETPGKGENKDKTYVNIVDVTAPEKAEDEAETECPSPAEDADEVEVVEDDEEEVEEAPKTQDKKRPWD